MIHSIIKQKQLLNIKIYENAMCKHKIIYITYIAFENNFDNV